MKINLTTALCFIPYTFAVATLILPRLDYGPTPSDLDQFNRENAAIAGELERQGWDMDETSAETLYPVSIADPAGNVITFYTYHSIHPEQKDPDSPTLLESKALDPADADESRPCEVGEYPATLYRKGDTAYLWWDPSEGTTVVVAYPPDAITEAEILKMAQSSHPISPE